MGTGAGRRDQGPLLYAHDATGTWCEAQGGRPKTLWRWLSCSRVDAPCGRSMGHETF